MTTGGGNGGFGGGSGGAFGEGDGFSFGAPTPPPKRRVPWPFVVAVLVVVGFVAAVVVYESGRDDHIEDQVVADATTTTFASPPIPSGSGSSGERPTAADRTTCKGIVQSFPLPPRSCRITTPSDLDDGERVPAVILLHGFNTSSEDVAGHGDWREAAARDRFVLVLPEGQGRSWNAGACCGLAQKTGIDDVGYLRAVLDQVVASPHVDASKVFVVGESNGGMMAYTFGCADSTRVAGIASVEGTPVASCAPARPIPVMHVHGTADLTVPYEGGQSLIAWVLGTQFRAVPTAFSGIAQAMGCQADPSSTETTGDVTTDDWTNCPDGVRARLDSVDGMGHQWPTGRAYNATDEILNFMGIGG